MHGKVVDCTKLLEGVKVSGIVLVKKIKKYIYLRPSEDLFLVQNIEKKSKTRSKSFFEK